MRTFSGRNLEAKEFERLRNSMARDLLYIESPDLDEAPGWMWEMIDRLIENGWIRE